MGDADLTSKHFQNFQAQVWDEEKIFRREPTHRPVGESATWTRGSVGVGWWTRDKCPARLTRYLRTKALQPQVNII